MAGREINRRIGGKVTAINIKLTESQASLELSPCAENNKPPVPLVFVRLWYFADADLLSGKASYRLCNTGQGLHR